MIKRRHFLIAIAFFLSALITLAPACNKKKTQTPDKSVSVHELFASKCTQCHPADQSLKLHGTEESILELINRMIKKGADVSHAQAMMIASYLSSPDRFLFEEKCTSCHEMKKVLDAHKKEALSKDTLKKMKEKGAQISEAEELQIFDYIMKNYPSNPPKSE